MHDNLKIRQLRLTDSLVMILKSCKKPGACMVTSLLVHQQVWSPPSPSS